MALRYYQREAVDSVFDYWQEEAGHPLIDMATGTGKSMTLATLFQELVTGWPDMRLVCVTHVVELVEANFKELLGIFPFAPADLYASALGRRSARAQILFAQLQTVYSKAAEIGWVDVLAIDEVHLVPNDANTMYRIFIDALLAINPDMKIVGLSATLFRLDSGRLDEGDDRLFSKVVYSYDIRRGIDDGYLTPITSKPTQTKQDTSAVPMRGNDLAKGALQKAVDKDWLNRQIMEEVMDTEGHRKTALFFCAGIEHATHMRDIVRDMGKTCEVLSGNTPKTERRNMIEALKRGEIWAISNDNVMSTGTNVPGIDLIVDAARTKSASRYVQRVGRGTRVVYPRGFDAESASAEERRAAIAGHVKPNCRYMDFAGNIAEHGPVDMITPKKPAKGEGTAPIKVCPQCEEILHASLRVCWCCGNEFEFDDTPKLQTRPTDAPIISTQEPDWRRVTSRKFAFHPGKAGKVDSVKVTYFAGYTAINDWLGPAHTGFFKTKTDRWWLAHGGSRPMPKTPLEFLERQGELNETAEISVIPNKKYWNVKDYKAGEAKAPANDNHEPPANDNRPSWAWELEADVPF
jgi:DNA repair protein RadD